MAKTTTRAKTTTKRSASGEVLEVTNPLDLWYLCAKCMYALTNPMKQKNGVAVFQRVVTRLIRQDSANFSYNWPYVGEVGFDMTKSPPQPIMSLKEPARPSLFPLSQYSHIYKNALNIHSLAIDEQMVSKTVLETNLAVGKPSRKGLMRIPDVLRLKDFNMAGGISKFQNSNIASLIEVKFPNDFLSRQQKEDYLSIVGNDRNRFRLLTVKKCIDRDKHNGNKEIWERDPALAKEPVFGQLKDDLIRVDPLNPPVVANPKYVILNNQIQKEFAQTKTTFELIYGPIPKGPILSEGKAGPSKNQAQIFQEGLAASLVLPVAAAASLAATPIRTSAATMRFFQIVRLTGATAATVGSSLAYATEPEWASSQLKGQPSIHDLRKGDSGMGQTILGDYNELFFYWVQ